VPAGFRFSVKLPRTISHELGLRRAGPALDRFLAGVEGLGDRLGGFLLPGLVTRREAEVALLLITERR